MSRKIFVIGVFIFLLFSIGIFHRGIPKHNETKCLDHSFDKVEKVPAWLTLAAKRVSNPFKSCQMLYPDMNPLNPYDEKYRDEIKSHNETYWKQPSVISTYKKKKKEADGYCFQCCPAQVLLMMDLARIKHVKTICEIGFNAGHSALSWLAAKPGTKLYSFDIGGHPYTRPMGDYLKRRYPGRFELIIGNSVKTLPIFIKKNPHVKCDVMSIDGGHRYKYAIHDFNNFRKMANSSNYLHFDDFPNGDLPINKQDLGRVWEEKLEEKQLVEFFKCNFKIDLINTKKMKGFAVGRIIV